MSPRVEAGVRDDVAGSVDLPATLFGLAGLGPWPEGGRDLTTPPPAAGTGAVGMRNAYAPLGRDHRTDGRVVEVREPRFYVVLDGVLWTGDARHQLRGDLDANPPAGGAPPALRPLFRHFERSLSGAEVTEQLDAETRAALRALGYGGDAE